MAILRPTAQEFSTYYSRYTNLVPDGEIVQMLSAQKDSFLAFLRSIPADKINYRYAPGKWTIGEMLMHINDTERIFLYRALALSRNEQKALPGFEQDEYVDAVDVSGRDRDSFLEEFVSIREASLTFLETVTEEQSRRSGTVSGGSMTVRGIAWILAGHVIHHINVLKERYL